MEDCTECDGVGRVSDCCGGFYNKGLIGKVCLECGDECDTEECEFCEGTGYEE